MLHIVLFLRGFYTIYEAVGHISKDGMSFAELTWYLNVMLLNINFFGVVYEKRTKRLYLD